MESTVSEWGSSKLAVCLDGGSNPGQRQLDNERGMIEFATRPLIWSGQGVPHACQLR